MTTKLLFLLIASAVAAAVVAPAPAAADGNAHTHGPDWQLEPQPTAGVASKAAGRRWCGDLRPGDLPDRNSGSFQYHAIYAFASDAASRFRPLAAKLQADAFAASRVIERSYRRAIRFDVGTRCGPRYLDISHVRLPFTTAELAQLAKEGNSKTFHAVSAALRKAGFPIVVDGDPLDEPDSATKNYLVWLDAPAPDACGEGHMVRDTRRTTDNANNSGGKLALVYQHRRRFCGHETVLHEIGHNLGALQPEAPNTRDGAHCEDAWEDVMCNQTAPAATRAVDTYFDYGNDDYWDPPRGRPLPWWTVNLSRFLCDGAGCNRPRATTATAQGAEPAKTRPRPAREKRGPASGPRRGRARKQGATRSGRNVARPKRRPPARR